MKQRLAEVQAMGLRLVGDHPQMSSLRLELADQYVGDGDLLQAAPLLKSLFEYGEQIQNRD